MNDRPLDPATVTVLRERREEIDEQIDLSTKDDDREVVADWTPVLQSIDRVLATPAVATLASEYLAAREVYHFLDRDEFFAVDDKFPPTLRPTMNAKGRRVRADLCRVGVHEVFDPRGSYFRRPRTMIVDGVRYVVE